MSDRLALRWPVVAALLALLAGACTRAAPDASSFETPDAAGSPFAGADTSASKATDSGGRAPDAFGAGAQGDGESSDSLVGPAVCAAGEQRCEGARLATCAPAQDGWSVQACFPGQYCRDGACRQLENNLVIAFDTSGSMAATVSGKACVKQVFPNCDPKKGCTRMDVSKVVFGEALAAVDAKTSRLALFRFPQRLARTSATSCNQGYYAGQGKISQDLAGHQSVDGNESWYWDTLHEIMSVPYPTTEAASMTQKKQIARWMDGVEQLQPTDKSCSYLNPTCAVKTACGKGACCGGKCHLHSQPELRSNGATPIGKTLFYIGEYFRKKIVIDGKACIVDSDCENPNYHCRQGFCADDAVDCRENLVVLFTDGGQNNDPTDYFAPQVSAKRLRYGLSCKNDNDCVGGAVCMAGLCLPKGGTGYNCMATSAPCKPGVSDPKDPLHCPAKVGNSVSKCLPDTLKLTSAKATNFSNNVLRAPNGKPFSVRVHVVDISGAKDLSKSFYLAMAGGGQMFTADVADSTAFLGALTSAFDMKNKKVCGTKSEQ